MSNSDTGINKVLRDIGRTPEIFRRDTPMLLKVLENLETFVAGESIVNTIILTYNSFDGYTENASFDNKPDAVAWLVHWLCDSRGAFDLCDFYAISADGIGRVVIDGMTFTELFDRG